MVSLGVGSTGIGPSDRIRLVRRRITAAFAQLGVLAVAIVGLGLYELASATPRAVLLAHDVGRANYLAGEVAHRVDELATSLELRTGHGGSESPSTSEVLADVARLDRAVRELPALLNSRERPLFDQIAPTLRQFRAAVSAVIAAEDRGDLAEARRAQEEEVLPDAEALEPSLDRLLALNQKQSADRIEELRDGLRHAGVAYAGGGAIFLVLLTAVAASTLRQLREQHDAVSLYLGRLEQANRDLEAFAGRIAHDLRGPLTPIVLLSSRLRAKAADPTKVEAIAARIGESAARADRMIEGMLAFSRNGAIEIERCDAEAAVGAALHDVADAAAASGVELASEVEPMRLAIGEPLLVVVLDNLLRNAIRYMGDRPLRRVTVTVARDGAVARLCVIDTGPGVPAEARARIFEPFFRLEPRQQGGAGLGLATAKRIVEAHGGAIGVEDAPGGGARFWVTLPLESAPTGQSSTRGQTMAP